MKRNHLQAYRHQDQLYYQQVLWEIHPYPSPEVSIYAFV